jgi:HPt (histidine-containing phosphotransfer) domain-containing protein
MEVRALAMGMPNPSAVTEAMNRLWTQFSPQIEERVSLLESAALAFAEGSLTSAQCEEASSAAHNLAGVLGTFGLDRGTELAREAELLYSRGPSSLKAQNGRPTALAAQLRAVVAARGK